MITSKYIDKIIAVMMLLALVVSLLPFSGKVKATEAAPVPQETGTHQEYEKKIFDTAKPVSIDIRMDEKKWTELLRNASKKEWQSCDVVINGTTFYNVGIRAKGDSSLSSIAEDSNTNRFSVKLKFDKYKDGQKCWGLDKLALNNNYGDATNMKEAFVYDMFKTLGADASLYNFAKMSVNGNYWGVYLALEPVDKSFLKRNYGDQKGALYKPGEDKGDSGVDEWEEMDMEGGAANAGDAVNVDEDTEAGARLDYIDDNLDSYWAIWQCQVTKTGKKDHERVVEALKNISEKKDLEKYMDMDNVLRYMAVHNFSVNNDSLSGDGAHNYYLYESDGKLNIIPWDYNLCFGAYDMEVDATAGESSVITETATDMINKPIDDSWRLTSFFDGILQNEEYRERYHKYYQQLVDKYVLGAGFDVFYSRTRSKIDDLVKDDPNALYSYEKYDAGAKMFADAVKLRGQSVSGQLSGTIPSTLEEQKKHPEKLIDASAINLSTMGSDSTTGEEFNAEEFADVDWNAEMAQFFEKQKAEKQKTLTRNMVQYSICFVALAAALVFAKNYKRGANH